MNTAPAWSPNGTKIAYEFMELGHSDIYIINADGSNPSRITNASLNLFSPAWSASPRTVSVQHPDCTAGWSQLSAGGRAKVSDATTTANRVRREPSTAAPIIGLLYPGNAFVVIEGPICADGLVFWKVRDPTIPGGTGWTAEGDGSEYWLQPYSP